MLANQVRSYFTPAEYLEWESRQDARYEYVNGEVYAMAGGTTNHNIIAVNLATALRNHLRGKGYRVFVTDVKLRISEQGPFHYPDVMVTCDSRDLQATQFIQYPCLIVEVLSAGTEAYDRGDKFIKNYRQIKTLQEYIIVEQKEVGVERKKISDHSVWEEYFYEGGDSIRLDSIDLDLPISLLYEDVDFSLI